MQLVDRLFRTDEWRTIPNAITAVRLLLLPVFVVLVVGAHYWSSLVVIAVVFATDFLDGFVARRTGAVSELGKWLDPVADRLTVIAVVAAFALGGLRGRSDPTGRAAAGGRARARGASADREERGGQQGVLQDRSSTPEWNSLPQRPAHRSAKAAGRRPPRRAGADPPARTRTRRTAPPAAAQYP